MRWGDGYCLHPRPREIFAPRPTSSNVCGLGFGSEPVTIAPSSKSMRASPLMPHPPMPMKWTRRPVNRLAVRDSLRNPFKLISTGARMVQPQGEISKRFILISADVPRRRDYPISATSSFATADAASGQPSDFAALAMSLRRFAS